MLNKLPKIFDPGASHKDKVLTLAGVGPGDPSLITIATAEAIQKATLIAFPVSKKGGKSKAAEIASSLINNKKTLPLVFPMVVEPNSLKEAWRNASYKLVEAVKNNHRVVYLSVGDVSLYSTSTYIISYIKFYYPEFRLRLIPGVNSFFVCSCYFSVSFILSKRTAPDYSSP